MVTNEIRNILISQRESLKKIIRENYYIWQSLNFVKFCNYFSKMVEMYRNKVFDIQVIEKRLKELSFKDLLLKYIFLT